MSVLLPIRMTRIFSSDKTLLFHWCEYRHFRSPNASGRANFFNMISTCLMCTLPLHFNGSRQFCWSTAIFTHQSENLAIFALHTVCRMSHSTNNFRLIPVRGERIFRPSCPNTGIFSNKMTTRVYLDYFQWPAQDSSSTRSLAFSAWRQFLEHISNVSEPLHAIF